MQVKPVLVLRINLLEQTEIQKIIVKEIDYVANIYYNCDKL